MKKKKWTIKRKTIIKHRKKSKSCNAVQRIGIALKNDGVSYLDALKLIKDLLKGK